MTVYHHDCVPPCLVAHIYVYVSPHTKYLCLVFLGMSIQCSADYHILPQIINLGKKIHCYSY